MKTQKEIEKMKDNIVRNIEEKQEDLHLYLGSDDYFQHAKVLYGLKMQYNILLEVLK